MALVSFPVFYRHMWLASGYRTGENRYGKFPLKQKVLSISHVPAWSGLYCTHTAELNSDSLNSEACFLDSSPSVITTDFCTGLYYNYFKFGSSQHLNVYTRILTTSQSHLYGHIKARIWEVMLLLHSGPSAASEVLLLLLNSTVESGP